MKVVDVCWMALLVLVACQTEPQAPAVEGDQTVMDVEPRLTPAERALANQVANRTLLQSVVDGNAALQRVQYPFSCSAQRGGLLVALRDSQQVHSWRLARSGASGQEVVHWYYRKGRRLLVVYERSEWRGDSEQIAQTLFYTKGDTVLHSQAKQVRGTGASLERQLTETHLTPTAVDPALWSRLRRYEQRVRATTAATDVEQVWCASRES